jgi:hypothetical protein
VFRFGTILEARKLVSVRGAGNTYDGEYRVQRATHDIAPGKYEQTFTLAREGTGDTSSTVPT